MCPLCRHLVAQYTSDDLSGKAACKAALQDEMGLPEVPDAPLLGFIGRLDYQKGPDLVLDAVEPLLAMGCQVRGQGLPDGRWRRRAPGPGVVPARGPGPGPRAG
jgi:glycogen synthase